MQGPTNTAWAFATAVQSDAQLLARAVEQRVSDFNMQEPMNTAWAFATAVQSHAQLFAAFARAVEQRVSDFNMQNDSCYPVFHTLL